jgi:nucleoside-diphosphate-sugar epimerase
MTVVISGASGFLGRHVVAAFLAEGRDVIALTRNAARLAAWPVGRPTGPQGTLRIVETDYAAIELPSAAAVVHLAAVRNRPGNAAREMTRVNVELTRSLALAALRSRATRFVHVGTALVLGSSRLPLEGTELAMNGIAADDPYVVSKAAGIRTLEAIEGLPLVTLLPSIVYGPDHPHARNRITNHLRRLLARPWRVAIGGAEPRNLVYVDDVVRAIAEAVRDGNGEHEGVGARRRLVTGENVTQAMLESALFAAAERSPTPRLVLPRVAVRTAAHILDTMLLRRGLGWSRRIETLLAPWCFAPSAAHTPLAAGIAATLRSL